MSVRRFRLLWLAILASASCAASAELQIVNSSGKTIHELYLAASGERTWGADRLREKRPSVIARGETHTVADVAPGSYQLMLVDADGSECQIGLRRHYRQLPHRSHQPPIARMHLVALIPAHRSSRAIRLDVSQRRPPIFCTSE
jgi:hypothetical protein